jgi:sulfate transport system ATP-binding protein
MSLPPTAAPERSKVAIRVEDIWRRFGQTGALRGVSLDFAPGELLALLGPSGSGKTTLLRILAGLDVPDSGRVFFDNADATSLPVQERHVGFVFQHYALFKHLTVAENIAYGLRARRRTNRVTGPEIARRVGELLDLIQLPGFADRYPSQLSGGERQRVALARALAVEPRVLLLDEPFGALDAKVRRDLRQWLREIHSKTGQTTIFVTHDQEEALQLADRIAVLNNGVLEQVGRPDDVEENPASPFVMTFLGETHSIFAHVVDGEVIVNGTRVPVSAGALDAGPTQLFLRPWDVRLAGLRDGHLRGIVVGTYRTNGRRRYRIAISNDAIIEVEDGPDLAVNIGDETGIRILQGRLFQPKPDGP